MYHVFSDPTRLALAITTILLLLSNLAVLLYVRRRGRESSAAGEAGTGTGTEARRRPSRVTLLGDRFDALWRRTTDRVEAPKRLDWALQVIEQTREIVRQQREQAEQLAGWLGRVASELGTLETLVGQARACFPDVPPAGPMTAETEAATEVDPKHAAERLLADLEPAPGAAVPEPIPGEASRAGASSAPPASAAKP